MRSRASESMGREETALHAHRFLLRAGLILGNVFGWIFVFDYFLLLSGFLSRALIGTFLMYGLSQLITIVITPLAAASLRRGTKPLLIWATVTLASAFVVLGATFSGYFTEPTVWGVAFFAVLLGLYRALYFAPYEVARGETDQTPFHGRTLWEILLALLPAFVGVTLITEPYAPIRLLFGAAALVGLSALPLLMLSSIHERFSYSYIQTFLEFAAPRNRTLITRSFLEGIQGAALFLMWPLVIFLILEFSYTMLGIIFTVTLLSLLLFRGILHYMLPKPHTFSTPVQVAFAISGWIGRLAAGTPLGIVVADVYAYTTRPERGTLTDPFVSEQAADNGSFIDEYTVLKEIALTLGRIALVALTGIALLSGSLIIAFGLALTLTAFASGVGIVLARLNVASI